MADNKKPLTLGKTLITLAKEVGYNERSENALVRDNLNNPKKFFAFILPENEKGGPYAGFSLVFFPQKEPEKTEGSSTKNNEETESKDEKKPETGNRIRYCMSLGVGTSGLDKDSKLSEPYARRLFEEVLPLKEGYYPFIKTDFSDIENEPNYDKNAYRDISWGKYPQYLCAGCIVEVDETAKDKNDETAKDKNDEIIIGDEDENWIVIKAWIAQYAIFRDWLKLEKDDKKKKKCDGWIKAYKDWERTNKSDNGAGQEVDEKKVKELLGRRKYVVLQGAPGVGKTWLANKIAGSQNADNAQEDQNAGQELKFNKTFFIQFHAETTYSDFVEGIAPKMDSNATTVSYERTQGVLVQAVEYALNNEGKNVLLIIDEINRANLANVLGPVFYLFEPNRVESDYGVKFESLIDPELEMPKSLSMIPKNLYVIATMNTADRSLAVVDFALRRRFAWYTIMPKFIESNCNNPETDEEKKAEKFGKQYYDEIANIFKRYASDAELNLQPGGSYFMAKDKGELDQKMEYELMPLIKEYLEQGLLLAAKQDFCDFFRTHIDKKLFR